MKQQEGVIINVRLKHDFAVSECGRTFAQALQAQETLSAVMNDVLAAKAFIQRQDEELSEAKV